MTAVSLVTSAQTRRAPWAVSSAVLLVAAAVVALAHANAAIADTGRSAEDILLGKPYSGPQVATPRTADGKPSFTGYWKLLHEDGRPDGNLGKDQPDFALPYSQKGREALQFNATKTIDPDARCVLPGVPRVLTSVLPFEILQTPQRFATFHQLGWHRWVWLDGRQRDPEQEPRYFGNAIGRWEKDTLVVESSGFKDSSDGKLWLDDNGNPQSSQSKVVERWTRPDYHHLNLEITYTDPVYYTRPVTYRRSWVLGEPGEGLREFSCEWNTWWVVHNLEPGPGRIGPNGNRGYGENNQIVPDLPLGSVDSTRGTGYWLYRKNKPKPSDLPEEVRK